MLLSYYKGLHIVTAFSTKYFFVTDIATALTLSILFIKPNLYTLVLIVLIFLATKFDNPLLKN